VYMMALPPISESSLMAIFCQGDGIMS